MTCVRSCSHQSVSAGVCLTVCFSLRSLRSLRLKGCVRLHSVRPTSATKHETCQTNPNAGFGLLVAPRPNQSKSNQIKPEGPHPVTKLAIKHLQRPLFCLPQFRPAPPAANRFRNGPWPVSPARALKERAEERLPQNEISPFEPLNPARVPPSGGPGSPSIPPRPPEGGTLAGGFIGRMPSCGCLLSQRQRGTTVPQPACPAFKNGSRPIDSGPSSL